MKLSTLLQNQAEQLRSQSSEFVAVDMLKKAGMDETKARLEVAQVQMEKEATSYLVSSGIDYDTALQMVKVADIKIKDLTEFKAEPSPEEVLAEVLVKAASLAEELEDKASEVDSLMEKIAELEARLEETPVVEKSPEALTKFAKSGTFTNEDLAAMQKLPTDTLTKLASIQDQPWTMGKGAKVDESTLDPLTQFLMS